MSEMKLVEKGAQIPSLVALDLDEEAKTLLENCDEDFVVTQGVSTSILGYPSQTRQPLFQQEKINNKMAPLHNLNSVQSATIAILKAGLDQLCWEPLVGLLEDLAASGTVSRQKLHECSQQVIHNILGVDLEPQVLQQFHTDYSVAEAIMIESLIYSYVEDLSIKKNALQNGGKKSFSSPEMKKKHCNAERKEYQPSYQKTTESFRRKQKSTCSQTLQKLKRLQHQGNLLYGTSQMLDSKSNLKYCADSSEPGDGIHNLQSTEAFIHVNTYNKTRVEVNKVRHRTLTSGDGRKTRSSYRMDRAGNKNQIEKIDDRSWERVQTALETYEGRMDNATDKRINSMEFTPSNQVKKDTVCVERTIEDKSCNEITPTSACSEWTDEEYLDEDDCECDEVQHEEPAVLVENNTYDKVDSFDPHNEVPCCESNEPIPLKEDSTEVELSQDEPSTPPLLPTPEEKRPAQCNKTTLTEPEEFNEQDYYCPPFLMNMALDGKTRIRTGCDLTNHHISEELMKILKEQLSLRKRYEELSLECRHAPEPIVKLPLSEFEKIRADNNMIMKRLTLMSSLIFVVLGSSLLTSVFFLLSPESGFFPRDIFDFGFISHLLCG